MRRVLPIIFGALLLAGCGSAASSSPPPTATPLRAPIAHTVTILPGKGVPVKKLPKGVRTTAARIKKLPVPKPLPAPTRFVVPESDYTATLFGSVTDAATHSPLAGATIVLDNPHHFTKSDGFGHYSLKTPGSSVFSVTVSMRGYLGELMAGKVGPHRSYRLNFALKRATGGTPQAPPPPGLFGQH